MIGFEELPLQKGESEQEGGVGQGPDQARWQGDFPAPDEAPAHAPQACVFIALFGFTEVSVAKPLKTWAFFLSLAALCIPSSTLQEPSSNQGFF